MSYAGNNNLPCNSCCCYNNGFCILRVVVHGGCNENRELIIAILRLWNAFAARMKKLTITRERSHFSYLQLFKIFQIQE
jgi:hypothetical protein